MSYGKIAPTQVPPRNFANGHTPLLMKSYQQTKKLLVHPEVINYLQHVYLYQIDSEDRATTHWADFAKQFPIPIPKESEDFSASPASSNPLVSTVTVTDQIAQLANLVQQLVQLQINAQSLKQESTAPEISKVAISYAANVIKPFQAVRYSGARVRLEIDALVDALSFNIEKVYTLPEWSEAARINVVKSCLSPEVQANVDSQFTSNAPQSAAAWIAAIPKLYLPSLEEECLAARTGVKKIRLDRYPTFAAMCNELDKFMPSTAWDEVSKLEQLAIIMGAEAFASLKNLAFSSKQRNPTYEEMKEQAILINLEGKAKGTSKTITLIKQTVDPKRSSESASYAYC